MKKVLHVFDHYLPKTEIWAFNLISQLKDYDVHIAGKVFLDEMPTEKAFEFISSIHSVLEKKDINLGWKKHFLKKLFVKLRKLSNSFQHTISHHIVEHNIDIIHAHFGNIGWELIKHSRKFNKPLIVSFYGWDYDMLPTLKPVWVSRYQELFEACTYVLVEGEYGKNKLIAKGCNPEKIIIQKLGVHVNIGNPIEKTKEAKHLDLIQIASFTEKKGQLYTVKAFAEALRVCPDLTLTLIGDDRDPEYRKSVQDEIENLGLANNVNIQDYIPYDMIADEFMKYDVFIHPSCTARNDDSEGGIPTIMFDAANNGLPIISTTHCDIPSLVLHNKTGLLTKEKSTKELAGSIERFYEMEGQEYRNFSSSSFKHVKENYSIVENAKLLEDIYGLAIDPNQKTTPT